jgi:hypothetical protein
MAAALLALVACLPPTVDAAEPNPAEFRGEWAVDGNCAGPLKFRVDAERFTLVNGTDMASYGDIAWPTTFFGPDYRGISRVAMPEFESLDSPFTVFFNWDEHRGVMRIDIPHGADIAGNAAYNAIMAAGRKLANRFPFGEAGLRKCAASQPSRR